MWLRCKCENGVVNIPIPSVLETRLLGFVTLGNSDYKCPIAGRDPANSKLCDLALDGRRIDCDQPEICSGICSRLDRFRRWRIFRIPREVSLLLN